MNSGKRSVLSSMVIFSCMMSCVQAAWRDMRPTELDLCSVVGDTVSDDASERLSTPFHDFLVSSAGDYFFRMVANRQVLRDIMAYTPFGNFDDTDRYQPDVALTLGRFFSQCLYLLTEDEVASLFDSFNLAYGRKVSRALQLKDTGRGVSVTEGAICWQAYWADNFSNPYSFFFNEFIYAEQENVGIYNRAETLFAAKALLNLFMDLMTDQDVSTCVVGFLFDKHLL